MPCCGAYGGLLCEGCTIYDTPEGRRLLFGDDWEEPVEELSDGQSQATVVAKAPRRVRKPIGPDSPPRNGSSA